MNGNQKKLLAMGLNISQDYTLQRNFPIKGPQDGLVSSKSQKQRRLPSQKTNMGLVGSQAMKKGFGQKKNKGGSKLAQEASEIKREAESGLKMYMNQQFDSSMLIEPKIQSIANPNRVNEMDVYNRWQVNLKPSPSNFHLVDKRWIATSDGNQSITGQGKMFEGRVGGRPKSSGQNRLSSQLSKKQQMKQNMSQLFGQQPTSQDSAGNNFDFANLASNTFHQDKQIEGQNLFSEKDENQRRRTTGVSGSYSQSGVGRRVVQSPVDSAGPKRQKPGNQTSENQSILNFSQLGTNNLSKGNAQGSQPGIESLQTAIKERYPQSSNMHNQRGAYSQAYSLVQNHSNPRIINLNTRQLENLQHNQQNSSGNLQSGFSTAVGPGPFHNFREGHLPEEQLAKAVRPQTANLRNGQSILRQDYKGLLEGYYSSLNQVDSNQNATFNVESSQVKIDRQEPAINDNNPNSQSQVNLSSVTSQKRMQGSDHLSSQGMAKKHKGHFPSFLETQLQTQKPLAHLQKSGRNKPNVDSIMSLSQQVSQQQLIMDKRKLYGQSQNMIQIIGGHQQLKGLDSQNIPTQQYFHPQEGIMPINTKGGSFHNRLQFRPIQATTVDVPAKPVSEITEVDFQKILKMQEFKNNASSVRRIRLGEKEERKARALSNMVSLSGTQSQNWEFVPLKLENQSIPDESEPKKDETSEGKQEKSLLQELPDQVTPLQDLTIEKRMSAQNVNSSDYENFVSNLFAQRNLHSKVTTSNLNSSPEPSHVPPGNKMQIEDMSKYSTLINQYSIVKNQKDISQGNQSTNDEKRLSSTAALVASNLVDPDLSKIDQSVNPLVSYDLLEATALEQQLNQALQMHQEIEERERNESFSRVLPSQLLSPDLLMKGREHSPKGGRNEATRIHNYFSHNLEDIHKNRSKVNNTYSKNNGEDGSRENGFHLSSSQVTSQRKQDEDSRNKKRHPIRASIKTNSTQNMNKSSFYDENQAPSRVISGMSQQQHQNMQKMDKKLEQIGIFKPSPQSSNLTQLEIMNLTMLKQLKKQKTKKRMLSEAVHELKPMSNNFNLKILSEKARISQKSKQKHRESRFRETREVQPDRLNKDVFWRESNREEGNFPEQVRLLTDMIEGDDEKGIPESVRRAREARKVIEATLQSFKEDSLLPDSKFIHSPQTKNISVLEKEFQDSLEQAQNKESIPETAKIVFQKQAHEEESRAQEQSQEFFSVAENQMRIETESQQDNLIPVEKSIEYSTNPQVIEDAIVMRLENQFRNVIKQQRQMDQVIKQAKRVNQISQHLRIQNGGKVTTQTEAAQIKDAKKSLKLNKGLVIPSQVTKKKAKKAYKKLAFETQKISWMQKGNKGRSFKVKKKGKEPIFKDTMIMDQLNDNSFSTESEADYYAVNYASFKYNKNINQHQDTELKLKNKKPKAELCHYPKNAPELIEKRAQSPMAKLMVKTEEIQDSIIKQGQLEPYDQAIHSHPPEKKQGLRYSKFHNYEKEIVEEYERANNDLFERINVTSNIVRQLFRPTHHPKPARLLGKKAHVSRYEQLKQLGEYEIDFQSIEDFFDPMRLKILVQPKKDATPFGKNPDYFFVKGIDYLKLNDYPSALKCFNKGIIDKGTHFLCRFNLGYTLFKVGHFQAAAKQYQILAYQCTQLKLHPEHKIPEVLFNKTVCEIQSGMYDEAEATADVCLEILKDREHKTSTNNILGLNIQDKDMLIDLLQLQGYARFRNGNVKGAGQNFEAADFRIGLIQQHELDLQNQRDNLRKQSHSNYKSVLSKVSKNMDKQTDYKSQSQTDQNYMTPHSMFELQKIDVSDFTNTANQQISNNKLNIRIPKINLNAQQKQESYLHVPGNIEEDSNERNTSGKKKRRKLLRSSKQELSQKKFYSSPDPWKIKRNQQTMASRLQDQISQIEEFQVSQNMSSTKKIELMSKKSSGKAILRSETSFSTVKKQKTISVMSKMTRWAKVSRKARSRKTNSLEPSQKTYIIKDLDKIKIKNQNLQSQVCFKKEEDRKFEKLQSFFDDFNQRLEASIYAGRQGNDEIKAFKEGLKKNEDEENKSSNSSEDTQMKLQKQLAALQNCTHRTRFTNRATQRAKKANLLEMEVEKDLIHLKNLLMKKKEKKKIANKANQVVKIEDREKLKDIVLRLKYFKEVQLKKKGVDESNFFYEEQVIHELDDIITKYTPIRTNTEEKKRIFFLKNGFTTYHVLKRGDILYEQGKEQAKSQFWVLGGCVTLIKTFVDHDIKYKLHKELRIKREVDGKNASDSEPDNLSEDQHLLSIQPNKTKLAIMNVDSAASAQNKGGQEDKISSISEHHSDTDEQSGLDTPPSESLDSSSSSIKKQMNRISSYSKDLIYKSTGLHKFQEFLNATQVRKDSLISGQNVQSTLGSPIIHIYDSSESSSEFSDQMEVHPSQVELVRPKSGKKSQEKKKRPLGYVPVKNRDFNPYQVEAPTQPVSERLKDKIEDRMSHKMSLNLMKRNEVGLQIDPLKVDHYKRMPAIIRIAQKNIYAGQMFANEIYEWWKGLDYTEKIIDHIDNLRKDKISLIKSVDSVLQQKYLRKVHREQEAIKSLSPIKQKTLMNLKLQGSNIQLLLKESQMSNFEGSEASQGTPKGEHTTKIYTRKAPPSPQVRSQSNLGLQLMHHKPMQKQNSDLKAILSSQKHHQHQGFGIFQQSKSGQPTLHIRGLGERNQNGHDSHSRAIQNSSLEQVNTPSDGGRKVGSRSRGIRKQASSSTVLSHELRNKDINLIDKFSMELLNKIKAEDERLHENEVWQRDIYKDLMRENTCLVIEDDTLVVEIPYSMEIKYLQYLQKLEQDARDL